MDEEQIRELQEEQDAVSQFPYYCFDYFIYLSICHFYIPIDCHVLT